MRVFVTGASGWIGSALVSDLTAAGHSVTGIARSEASAAAMIAAGVETHRGTLDDLDLLKTVSGASDGVVHLAFKHDEAFSGNFQGAADSDRRAVETIGDALAGSNKPLVIASGTLGIKVGAVATERDFPPASGSGFHVRHATAEYTLSLASRGVRSSVLRLPPTCHGDGDRGFMAHIVNTARAKGVSGYIGDGSNRWPAANRLDAAHLFRLAVENAPAGWVLQAIDDEGIPIRTIAQIIGRHLNVPVASILPENAGEHFGWLAPFLGLDSPATSTITRELLGWKPTHQGLIADLEEGHYFNPVTTP